MVRRRTKKQTYSIDAAIPNSHNLHSTITEKLQKYTDLKEELIRIRRLKTTNIVLLLVLSTVDITIKNYMIV